METPLKLLEGLIIPKSMKGGREAWVFSFVILPLVGIALVAGARMMTSMIGGRCVVGGVRGVRACAPGWSSSPNRSSKAAMCRSCTRWPTADALDRALPRPGRRGVQRGAQANRRPPRRRAETRRGQLSQGVCRRRGPARRKAAQDQRGLRRAHGRGPDDATARHARSHRRNTTAGWPSCATRSRPACRSSTRSTRLLKERLATSHETAWRAMADRWRDGMKAAAAELEAINREVDGYCPAWNDGAWADRRVAAAGPAGGSLRDGHARARRPAAAGCRPTPV